MRRFFSIALMVILAAAFCAAQVTVSSPTSGSTVASPVNFAASATSTTSGAPITAMRIYVDGVSMYTVNSASLNTSLSPTKGAHTVTVVAWDVSGKSYTKGLAITVGAATAATTAAPAAAAGQVAISAPTSGATVTSPVKFVASASSNDGLPIMAMRIYVDSASMYTVNASSLNTSLPVATGGHTVVMVAWDSSGKAYTNTSSVTVTSGAASSTPTATSTSTSASASASSSFDAYPSTALVSAHMENSTWDSCNCGGTGSAPAGESLSQGNESIKGNGSGIAGWLWYTPFNSSNSTNWIMDYNVTPKNLSGAVALEFDGNQIGSLGNFVFGTECNYGYNPSMKTVWRFWTMSGSSQTWATTTYACPITQVNHTYHVQMHFVASSGSYQVSHVMVTDLSTGAVVQNVTNLGTYSAVNSSHGSSIDVQADTDAGNTVAAQYQNISIIRW